MILIKLATNKQEIILGTHSSIPRIRLQNTIEHNKNNLTKGYNKEEILDFIIKELVFLGWKIVYNYNKVKTSNCETNHYFRLEQELDELFFVDMNKGGKL